MPLLAQIEGMGEPRQARPHGPVADQEHRIRIGVFRRVVWTTLNQGQRHHLRTNAELAPEHNLR